MTAVLLLGLAVPASAQSVQAGITAWQSADYESAVRIWRPLAEKGNPDAQFNLAQAYRLGRGVPINLAAAETWLKRAAYQGHVDAETTLGLLMFQNGNRVVGIYWLKAAAAKNDPRAMLVYGTALFNGDGVKADSALGYAYVSRAAALGLGPAKDTLAQMEQSVSAADRSEAATLLASAKPGKKSAAVKPASAKPVREKIQAAKVASASPPVAAASVRATPASGNWRIQLGAFGQRRSAEALFRKVSGNSALSGRSASYVAAGSVVRLQVGPFESRAAAANACHSLAAHGQACFPVPAK